MGKPALIPRFILAAQVAVFRGVRGTGGDGDGRYALDSRAVEIRSRGL